MPDQGLSNERTALAWHRTALSVLAASALVTRWTVDTLGLVSIISVGVGGLIALWIFTTTGRHYIQKSRTTDRAHPKVGLTTFALMCAIASISLVELGALLSTRAR